MLQRTTLITSLLLALGGTAHAATGPVGPVDVSVRYTTTVCATPCKTPESRQWYFWRNADRIEIRDSANALGEIWKQDAKGRISYIYLEPSHQRGIEYNPTDLKIINQKRSWDKLASIVTPAELKELTASGETEVFGHKAVVYSGILTGKNLEVVWVPELQLATRVTHTYPDHQSVTELQAFVTDKDNTTAISDSQLADYQLVDFSDVGDMETAPGMSWLKQALGAPGHTPHD